MKIAHIVAALIVCFGVVLLAIGLVDMRRQAKEDERNRRAGKYQRP